MKSHLGLMLEQNWALEIGPLMELIIANLRAYWLGVHWDIMMVKFLALTKASNWDLRMVKCLALYLEM